MGIIADTLRQTMEQLAASDARMTRRLNETSGRINEMIESIDDYSEEQQIIDAIALLKSHGYTVTR